MRGRWASAALGAGIARRRAGQEMNEQAQAFEAQQPLAQQLNNNKHNDRLKHSKGRLKHYNNKNSKNPNPNHRWRKI
jgi:hypothetical protein